MPGGHKNIKHEDGNTFSSTNQPANRGRKKNIYTIVRDVGYSKDDITTAFRELVWYTLPQLKKLHSDEKKPAIIRIISNQIYLALKKGDMNKIKEILEYTIGKPSQPLSHSGSIGTGDIILNVTETAADEIRKLSD